MNTAWIILIVLAALVLLVVGLYKNSVGMRNHCRNATRSRRSTGSI